MHAALNPFTTGSSTSGSAMPSHVVKVHTSPLAGARQVQPTSSDFTTASSSAQVTQSGTITVHALQPQPQKPDGQTMSSSGTVFQDTGSVELAQTTVAGAVVAAETLATQTVSAGAGSGCGAACDEFCNCCAAGCQLCGTVLSGLGRGLFCLLTCCFPRD